MIFKLHIITGSRNAIRVLLAQDLLLPPPSPPKKKKKKEEKKGKKNVPELADTTLARPSLSHSLSPLQRYYNIVSPGQSLRHGLVVLVLSGSHTSVIRLHPGRLGDLIQRRLVNLGAKSQRDSDECGHFRLPRLPVC